VVADEALSLTIGVFAGETLTLGVLDGRKWTDNQRNRRKALKKQRKSVIVVDVLVPFGAGVVCDVVVVVVVVRSELLPSLPLATWSCWLTERPSRNAAERRALCCRTAGIRRQLPVLAPLVHYRSCHRRR